ncbi:MAG TPA: hypothetical protein VLL07_03195 [Pontiella sp.]|nr:hypothetical protein [Pontiella sp.]
MKKTLSIAAIALMMAGSMAFACDTCGCKDKKAEKEACCTAEKKCDSCSEEKACAACQKKAEAKKAEASE